MCHKARKVKGLHPGMHEKSVLRLSVKIAVSIIILGRYNHHRCVPSIYILYANIILISVEEKLFDLDEYLEHNFVQAAPVSCFKHVCIFIFISHITLLCIVYLHMSFHLSVCNVQLLGFCWYGNEGRNN